MRVEGRAWKFGDHVDTDVIVPGKYLKLTADEAAKHIMEGIDPDFQNRVRPGDIIVAGRNFGCGSSRETAPHALKLAGIGAVVAQSFARIFYRNAFNLGLLVVELPDVDDLLEGDVIAIDMEAGRLENKRTGTNYPIPALPPHLLEMLNAGGLVPYLERRAGIAP